MAPPTFSIVLSTYNRGRHIEPTIRSVLQQSFADYELIIVGDCCNDGTADTVRPYLSQRVIWHNLESRAGNQFGPNNAGCAMARGGYVAYLGHDDIWAPDHLAALHRAFAADADGAFAVSGCIIYGPPGSGVYLVSGLFQDDSAKFVHHFPPCSFAHRREVVEQIGPWRSPRIMSRHTDADFLLRAAEAGLRFVCTETITVHKVAADIGRYLAYVRQDSSEQEALLEMLAEPGFPAFAASVVAHARSRDTYMTLKHPDYSQFPTGALAARSETSRGLVRPTLARLDGKFVLEQSDEPRGMDWRRLKRRNATAFRWSGPNPRPKMLLPVAARGQAELRIGVVNASDRGTLDRLTLRVNDIAVPWTFQRRSNHGKKAVLQCRARLHADDHSVLEFDLTGGASVKDLLRDIEGRAERIAIGWLSAQPLPWYKQIWS